MSDARSESDAHSDRGNFMFLLCQSNLCCNVFTVSLFLASVNQSRSFSDTRRYCDPAFLARDSMLYAIARPSVCPSVRPSVTRVDQSKTVEVRIMQFSPYSSPIPLVFTVQVSSRNSDGIPPSGGVKQGWVQMHALYPIGEW